MSSFTYRHGKWLSTNRCTFWGEPLIHLKAEGWFYYKNYVVQLPTTQKELGPFHTLEAAKVVYMLLAR